MKKDIDKIAVDDGWDEIETRQIRFTGFASKMLFGTVGDLLCSEHNFGRQHDSCSFCGALWTEMPTTDSVCVADTTNGCKLLCERCFNKFDL